MEYMIIPIIIPTSPYIKKEDIPYYLKNSRLSFIIAAIASVSVAFILQFLVMPRVVSLYQQFDTPIPTIVQFSLLINGIYTILVLFLVYIIASQKPKQPQINSLLKSYKKGEMIHVNKLRGLGQARWEMYLILMIIVYIAILVFLIILPIYNISNAIS
jgi:hypothetical protein